MMFFDYYILSAMRDLELRSSLINMPYSDECLIALPVEQLCLIFTISTFSATAVLGLQLTTVWLCFSKQSVIQNELGGP